MCIKPQDINIRNMKEKLRKYDASKNTNPTVVNTGESKSNEIPDKEVKRIIIRIFNKIKADTKYVLHVLSEIRKPIQYTKED